MVSIRDISSLPPPAHYWIRAARSGRGINPQVPKGGAWEQPFEEWGRCWLWGMNPPWQTRQRCSEGWEAAGWQGLQQPASSIWHSIMNRSDCCCLFYVYICWKSESVTWPLGPKMSHVWRSSACHSLDSLNGSSGFRNSLYLLFVVWFHLSSRIHCCLWEPGSRCRKTT